jgi:hypothetical protein
MNTPLEIIQPVFAGDTFFVVKPDALPRPAAAERKGEQVEPDCNSPEEGLQHDAVPDSPLND